MVTAEAPRRVAQAHEVALGLGDLLRKLREAAVGVLELGLELFHLRRQLAELDRGVGVGFQELRRLRGDVLVELLDLFLARRLALQGLDLLLDVAHLAVEAVDVVGRDAGDARKERRCEKADQAEAAGNRQATWP